MARHRTFVVKVERVSVDHAEITVRAPTLDVAETRALADADRDRGIVWSEREDTLRVSGLKIQP